MRKLTQLLTLLCLTPFAFAAYTPPLEYGVAATITFDLYNTDGTLDVDEADGGTEVTLYCDEGAGATATNDFVDEGPYYSLSLTAAELQCARLVVSVGATDTNNIHIWTVGSASAQVDNDGSWLDAVPWNSVWDAEVESEVDDALGGGTGTSLNAIPWNSSWDTEAQSEANDALLALGLDHLLSTSVTGADVSDDSIIAQLVSDDATADWDSYNNVTDSKEALRNITGQLVVDVGTAGAGLTGVPYNSAWDPEIQSEVTDALNAYDPPTNAELTSAAANVSVDELQATALADMFNTDSGTTYGSAVSGSVVAQTADNAGGSGLTESGIADAVWNETRSGHTTAGTYGEHTNADVVEWLGSVPTALETSTDIADAVLDEDLTAHQTTGSLGAAIGDGDAGAGMTESGGTGNHMTAVPYNSAWDTDIQSEAADALIAYDPPTRTELTSDINGLNDLSAAQVNAEVDTALADYDAPTRAELTSDISGLNNLSVAQVNAEVDTALSDIHLDHLLATDYDPASPPGTATAYLNEIAENDVGVTRFTVNALENGPSGSGASAAAISDAVWTEAIADHSGTSGSTAEQLAAASAGGDPWTTAIPGSYTSGQAGNVLGNLNDLSAAQVNAEADTALADYDAPTRAELTSDIGGLNDLSAAQVNAEADTALADYDPPTRAELTTDIGSVTTAINGLNDPTAAAIAAAVMAETCEDQGSGYTVQECLSILLAEAAGTATYTNGTRTWVVSDPSGTETRLTIVYGVDADGDRSTSTPAPVTP